MRRAILVLIVLTTLFSVPVAVSAADAADFDGIWAGVDIDGTSQVLLVTQTRSGDLRFVLLDDGGTVCLSGGSMSPLIGTGRGSYVGDVATVDYRIWCLNGYRTTVSDVDYTLNGDGTLTDEFGADFHHIVG